MTNNRHPILLLAALAIPLFACFSCKDGAPSSTSGAPATSGASAAGADAPGGKPSGKTVHVTQTVGECTFDLEAPEALKQSAKDGMSVTLESDSFSFVGFEGTTLHSKPEHALDPNKDYKEVYRGTENNVQVTVLVPVKNDKPATNKHVVGGMGGEPYSNERSLGCTFLCDGVASRQADVIAMCKSIRIKVTPEPKH